jgi:hypothetical protein
VPSPEEINRQAGFEPARFSSGKPAPHNQGGAESGAVGANSGPIDPDLAAVIHAWPTLPEATRRQIAGVVKAARRE